MIQKLKRELLKTFDMKDLGSAKRVLGMEILRDRKAGKLWLSQERYIEPMLERFNMKISKLVSTPLVGHFKLIRGFVHLWRQKKCEISVILYSSANGSLIYAMVCTHPDVSHSLGVVRRFLANPSKAH